MLAIIQFGSCYRSNTFQNAEDQDVQNKNFTNYFTWMWNVVPYMEKLKLHVIITKWSAKYFGTRTAK